MSVIFHYLSTDSKGSLFSTSSLTYVICCLIDVSHYDWYCKVLYFISHNKISDLVVDICPQIPLSKYNNSLFVTSTFYTTIEYNAGKFCVPINKDCLSSSNVFLISFSATTSNTFDVHISASILLMKIYAVIIFLYHVPHSFRALKDCALTSIFLPTISLTQSNLFHLTSKIIPLLPFIQSQSHVYTYRHLL